MYYGGELLDGYDGSFFNLHLMRGLLELVSAVGREAVQLQPRR